MEINVLIRNIHQKFFLLLILLLPTQLGLHFWPNWASVFGIRVDYLAPTIYLTDILVIGILLSWGWENKRKSKFTIYHLPFTIYLLIGLFIYLLITSLLVAQNQDVAIYKLVKIIEFSLLGFYVYKTNPLSIIHLPLTIALIYSSLIAWAQFLLGHTIGGPFWWLGERTFDVNTPGIALVNIGGQEYLRPYATFPHPNVLAGFLLIGLVFLLGRNSKWEIGALILTFSALILAFSHNSWVAGIIVLFLVAVPFLRERLVIITRLALVLLIIISLMLPFIPRIETASREVNQRLELAKAAGAEIRDYPLTGVGLNNFIVRLPEYGRQPAISWWLQPVHNIFLLVFAETGIVGFGVFIWFLFFILKKLSIHPTKLPSILLAFLAILLTGAADHYWLTLQQGQLIFAIILGLSLAKS